MGLAFRSVGMKRGSALKSLRTKRKVTKAKRQKKEDGELPKANGMNECYTHCLPLYEVTVKKRRKKGCENINKNKVRWCAKEMRHHMKGTNCTSDAVFRKQCQGSIGIKCER